VAVAVVVVVIEMAVIEVVSAVVVVVVDAMTICIDRHSRIIENRATMNNIILIIRKLFLWAISGGADGSSIGGADGGFSFDFFYDV
jgi:hypothetical protein